MDVFGFKLKLPTQCISNYVCMKLTSTIMYGT
uniref:Uncharacterized protein n=1 Tax=Anguilla anguilla TaxID=7936 RepID=A0A0E9VY73_ANGAN